MDAGTSPALELPVDPWATPALADEPDEPDGMRIVLVGAFLITFALLVLAGTGVVDLSVLSGGGCGGG